VLDRDGLVVPNAALTVNFRIAGPGELAAVATATRSSSAASSSRTARPNAADAWPSSAPRANPAPSYSAPQAKGLTPPP